MTSLTRPQAWGKIIVGVDTHKHVHVAVTIDALGARLGDLVVPADTSGYRQLDEWAVGVGEVEAFGVEGTGSYGAGLTSYLRRQGHRIVEVNRGDRRARRANVRCLRRVGATELAEDRSRDLSAHQGKVSG